MSRIGARPPVTATRLQDAFDRRSFYKPRTDAPEALYAWYTGRGETENWIKDLKLACFADRLSCHGFWANQFRLLLHAAAYWLLDTLRRWLARLGVMAYLKIVHPVEFFPDPTERLVGAIREFVEGNGAKFLVGIQGRDEALARYLERSGIPYVSLDGAAFYPSAKVGGHWTPAGQVVVAERVFKLLTENSIVP